MSLQDKYDVMTLAQRHGMLKKWTYLSWLRLIVTQNFYIGMSFDAEVGEL